MTESKSRALAAAHQAQEAAVELIRFVREGPHYRYPPFGDDIEVVEKLADALKMALEVEDEQGEVFDRDDAAMRDQLLGACVRFLDGWAG